MAGYWGTGGWGWGGAPLYGGGYAGTAAGTGYGGYGGSFGSGYGGRGGYATVAGEESCCGADAGGVGGAGGTACGTACCGTACGGSGTNVLSYVGAGGDYTQETTYRYVGAGAGQFGLIRIPGRSSCCCWLLVPGLLAFLLIPYLVWMMSDTTTTTTTTTTIKFTTPQPAPEKPPKTTTRATTTTGIQCDDGLVSDWTPQKKAYCCQKVGKGCPTTHPPPPPVITLPPRPKPKPPPTTTTTPCPIDCNAGYDDLDALQWVHGWSAAKKIYCCKTANKGCPSELPPPSGLPPSGEPPEPEDRKYDCDAGYHECMHCLKESWSPKKISWCCRTQHKGCEGEIPA